KYTDAIADDCGPPPVGAGALLDACGGDVATLQACAPASVAGVVEGIQKLAWGAATMITDTTAAKCQKAAGPAAAPAAKGRARAGEPCLDGTSSGALAGDAQLLCLGSCTNSGLVLPSDARTGPKVLLAQSSLVSKLSRSCPGTVAEGLPGCGHDAT